MRYLLHHNGIGAIIDMPRGKPSEYWAAVTNAFIRTAGGNPSDPFAWCDMIHLYPERVAEGVTYDEELAGSGGASFRLHRMPEHTPDQISMAKAKLRRDRDVVHMSVIHINKLIEFSLP